TPGPGQGLLSECFARLVSGSWLAGLSAMVWARIFRFAPQGHKKEYRAYGNPAEEIRDTTGLQDRRVYRLSGAWRRTDRHDRGAGSSGPQAGTLRHRLPEGQDAPQGAGRQGDVDRHAQAV